VNEEVVNLGHQVIDASITVVSALLKMEDCTGVRRDHQ